MEYFSNFIWEKGDETYMRASLVLQYALVCKRSVLLACVCESENLGSEGVTESGYFTEGLVEWFHRRFLRLCEKRMSDEEVEKLLYIEISHLQDEIKRFLEKKEMQEQLHFWGILLWDNRFWIFCKGDCEGYLVNHRFQKKHMRRLMNWECRYSVLPKVEFVNGRVQHKLGILLCTAGFMSNMEEKTVAEVLNVDGDVSEERIKKRLQELWQENIRHGEMRSAAAVYLYI